ncbi:hypothetical protein BZG36_02093 [Bifiguratus adelaidae]|uniref:Carnitine O-acetyltransferase, mitochondrial n=1 Tax=Bifiguratus adelaidae TaxID=1938954 RepID=A0A261Y386_9FUNG|nr:hypothetical protein BZG36_02093 [Bifiguratus adelaidae]
MAPKTPEDKNAPRMLRYQANLPKLPVPALEATLEKYAQTLKPLLSEQDLRKSLDAISEFKRPGGIGEELQKRLVARREDPSTVNWLEEWWNDSAYMGYRDPVVIYVSYFYSYKDDKLRRSNVKRAAAITTAALAFRDQVVKGSLEPEYAKGEPLCMASYKYMFSACRIPNKPSDYAVTYDPHANSHIIVIRKNRFFIIEAFVDGKQLSTKELESQFQLVVDQAGNQKGEALGALTAENRGVWTDYRNLLLETPDNKELLQKIESAAFVVCLDDSSPQTRNELVRACWHGDGQNRFFDKPLQFIVFENAKAGFMGEHSCMDGTPTLRLNDFVCEVLERNKVDHGSESVRSNLTKPAELKFTISPQVSYSIQSACQNFDKLINAHDMHVLAYNGYGKNMIKKFKISPDAYAQMVIQLAYYKMFGVLRPTYESGQTRKFQHGRTETCRTVSSDMKNWVLAMENPSVSVEAKVMLGRKAMTSHVRYMNDACDGRGVDRHLFGLKKSLKPNEPVPALFQDPAYSYSSHWYLSTSQLSSEYFTGYGWGQVVPDGFGIAYMVKNNTLQFNVASVRNMNVHGKVYPGATTVMIQCLEDAADDMREVFEADLAKEAPKSKL